MVRKGCFAISLIVVALSLSVGMSGQLAKIALAEESAWFSPNDPGLEEFPGRTPLARSDYNTDCVPETGVIRPAGIIPPNINPLSEETISGCALRSASGRFLQSYFQLNGTHQYASLSETVRPIPGSTSVLKLFGGTSQVSNAYLIPGFSSLLKPTKLADGKLKYNLDTYTPIYIKDIKSNLLDIDHNSISFSANGQWLIASTFQGILRYNLNTREQLLFDTALNYQSGVAPLVQSAISNDGHYAVIAAGPHSRFRLYNLEDCPTLNSASLGRKNCKYRELFGIFPPKTGDQVQFQEVRFLSNYALRFYRREQFGPSSKTSQYILLAPGTSKPHFEYLALGDSYSAGEGAYQYRPGTNTDTNSCRNSEISYPYLIKTELQMIQAESVACAGATTWDVSNPDPDYAGQTSDGLKLSQRNTGSILSAFLPGYLPQVSFVEHYLPDVVTISIGGNDIGFGDKLRSCLSPGTCFASYEDRLEVFQEINHLSPTLQASFSSIRSADRAVANIYATGYPQVAAANGNCGLNVLLNNDEIIFSNLLIATLNSVIAQAAATAGINYIDVTHAFDGHRLCETVYSNTALNGLTAGHDALDWGLFKGPIAGESFHPNALGHRLYKQAIARQLKTPAAPTLLTSNTTSQLLNAPKQGRPISHLIYASHMAADNLLLGSSQTINIDKSQALKPNSSFTLSVGGSERNILSDQQGTITTSVAIELSLAPGFTALSVSGKNLADVNIKLYKTVYLAKSADDFDGDGSLNNQDDCPLYAIHDCIGSLPSPSDDKVQVSPLVNSKPSPSIVSNLVRSPSLSVTNKPLGPAVLSAAHPKPARPLKHAGRPARKINNARLLLAIAVLVFAIGFYLVIRGP